jgi:hypothetical protein
VFQKSGVGLHSVSSYNRVNTVIRFFYCLCYQLTLQKFWWIKQPWLYHLFTLSHNNFIQRKSKATEHSWHQMHTDYDWHLIRMFTAATHQFCKHSVSNAYFLTLLVPCSSLEYARNAMPSLITRLAIWKQVKRRTLKSECPLQHKSNMHCHSQRWNGTSNGSSDKNRLLIKNKIQAAHWYD